MKYPWLSSPLEYHGWFDYPSRSFVTRKVTPEGVSTPPVTPHPSDNSSPPAVNSCTDPMKPTGETRAQGGQTYKQYVDCIGNHFWYATSAPIDDV